MLRFLVFFCGLMCVSVSELCAQFEYDKKSIDDVLGFACGSAPRPTSPVLHMEKWLLEGRTDKIREALYSKHPTYQFLAVIILDGRSTNDQKRIDRLKRSHKKVPVCDGCLVVGPFPLKMLLDEQKPGYFRKYALRWLSQLES